MVDDIIYDTTPNKQEPWPWDPEAVRGLLDAELPDGMRLTSVEEIDLKHLNGAWVGSMSELLTSAEFVVHAAVPGAVAR